MFIIAGVLVSQTFMQLDLLFPVYTSEKVDSLRYTLGRTIAPISIPLTVWIGYQWTFFILSALALLSAFLFSIMFNMHERQQQLQGGSQS